MPAATIPTAEPRDDRAVVIFVRDDATYTPAELVGLATTLQYEVVAQFSQSARTPDRSTYFGAGRLAELAEYLEAEQIPTLLVDDDLTPRQHREMGRALNVDVLDRSDIILRIFERNARTLKARIEVELARLIYMLPRQRDDGAGDDRRGGGGRGERGHTNVQLSKERIRDRIATLKASLGKAEAAATAQRERRGAAFQVALVGYTNAGKSSLMRALTGSEVLVRDQLFATLGTTVRQLEPQTTPPIVVADTVGFIENLPHNLIASFQSTLDEAHAADLLLLVVDGAAPAWREHLEVTRSTLASIGASPHRVQVVFNKIDAASVERRQELSDAEPDAWFVSALQPDLVNALSAKIADVQLAGLCDESLVVPFDAGQLRAEVFANATVIDEQTTADAWVMRVAAREEALDRWRAQLQPPQRGDTVDALVAVAAKYNLDVIGVGELDETGLDNRVAHAVDGDEAPWILRQPRRDAAFAVTRPEHRALRLLQGYLSAYVPQWVIHAPDLVAYPTLPGTPTWTLHEGEVQWNIDTDNLPNTYLESVAAFLVALQRVPLTAVSRARLPILDVAQVRAEHRERMLATREVLDPPSAVWAFWNQWLDDTTGWPPTTTLTHGDFHPGHMLLNDRGQLVAVLDWTEARVGDPAQDLAGIYATFGVDGLTALLEVYRARGGLDWPGLDAHVAKIWAFTPVEIAWWAQQSNEPSTLDYAHAMLAEVASFVGC